MSTVRGPEIEEIINLTREEIYVAVGKDSTESMSALKWALKDMRNREETLIILLHIQLPLHRIPTPMGMKLLVNQVSNDVLKAHLKVKEKELNSCMNKYLDICTRAQVRAKPLFVEKDDIAKGIVEVISERNVKKLVMGTTSAGRSISRRMLMSTQGKAEYVRKHAIESCNLSIICKNKLVFRSPGYPVDDVLPSKIKSFDCPLSGFLARPSEAENNSRSVSLPPNLGWVNRDTTYSDSEIITFKIDSDSSSQCDQDSTSEILFDELYKSAATAPSGPHVNQDVESLKEQLGQALRVAEKAKAESLKEIAKRKEAEAAAVKANYRVRELESAIEETMKEKEEIVLILRLAEERCKELSRRKSEVEENLESVAERIRKISSERDEAFHELQAAQRKFAAMIEQTHRLVQETEAQIELLQDSLHSRPPVKTVNFFSSFYNHEFREYTFDDVKTATSNFSEHLKLGEGGYGVVYKGEIGQTSFAVKILRENSLQGQQEFKREINILRQVRHPNLVRVVGVCSERGCIFYEYMSNGCLADHLSSRKARPPLPWHARIRIAAEICSALQYLHGSMPDPIVHRDLKPSNVLLDQNYTSKISDFGLARPLPRDLHTESDPKGTFCYMDPEYLTSGKYSTKSDVYSLGIIILQLLTGKLSVRMVEEVEDALKCAKLDEILDPSAGDWPFAEATQMAYIALHCTSPVREERPELQPTVMKMLSQLRDMAVPATNAVIGPVEECQKTRSLLRSAI